MTGACDQFLWISNEDHAWSSRSDAMQTLLLAADAGANPVNVEWLTLVTTIVIFGDWLR